MARADLNSTQTDRLLKAALERGLPLAGICDLLPALPSLAQHVERYDRWLAEGRQDGMEYLVRGRDRRADPRLVFGETRSVMAVAVPYQNNPPGEVDPARGPRFARYLGGGDYHTWLKERIDRVLAGFAAELAAEGGPTLSWKSCVDTSAVLERAWASLCGLGWIGKNSLLIHPRWGSYLFLGVAFLNVETGRVPMPLAELCGQCRKCLDACPTQAILSPGVVDAPRCISALTLERRGPWAAGSAMTAAPGAWVAGCDVCQEVCPFNQRRDRGRAPEAERDLEGGDGLKGTWTWERLLAESGDEYAARVRGTALSRVKAPDFDRNLAHAFLATVRAVDGPGRQALDPLLPLVRARARGGQYAAIWSQALSILQA
ncbi:MAG TPA: tRNA epoxyqueuosine(34) reductase QueG [Bdellovibrionota bacterium]|jgi:epoxyqueuosine reductase|nr:tRNA epoxyqueuosine(34) reductase QueG [Bdellovibrionota bacterium]